MEEETEKRHSEERFYIDNIVKWCGDRDMYIMKLGFLFIFSFGLLYAQSIPQDIHKSISVGDVCFDFHKGYFKITYGDTLFLRSSSYEIYIGGTKYRVSGKSELTELAKSKTRDGDIILEWSGKCPVDEVNFKYRGKARVSNNKIKLELSYELGPEVKVQYISRGFTFFPGKFECLLGREYKLNGANRIFPKRIDYNPGKLGISYYRGNIRSLELNTSIGLVLMNLSKDMGEWDFWQYRWSEKMKGGIGLTLFDYDTPNQINLTGSEGTFGNTVVLEIIFSKK